MTYDQAFEDHQYLWKEYGPAHDMTGGYTDSEDLDRLLANPTKVTARKCLETQIAYWFQVGYNDNSYDPDTAANAVRDDPRVAEIADRHCVY